MSATIVEAVTKLATKVKGETVKPANATIAAALDTLADALAGENVQAKPTIADAIDVITENYTPGGGGGGSATTDVYLWNMTGNVVPTKVEYTSGYSSGNPTYTELETEGITNEFNENTVYGIKVKDCPAGGHLNYTLPSGYVFAADGAPHIGYSAVLFPAMPGISSTAMIPIDGMYQVAPFAVMTSN